MSGSSASYIFVLLLIGFLLIVSVLFFGYVFTLATWAVSTKIISVLVYVAVVALGFNWFQAGQIANLKYQVTASGKGSETLFSDLYQNSPVAYLRTDATGRILHGNAAALRLCGMQTEQLVTNNLFSLIREAEVDAARALNLEQRIYAGQFVNEVEAELFVGGGSRWVLVSAFPYEHNRERLITLIDITEQKAVDIAKTEFVSLASHQLRTPISAILWNLELLTNVLGNAPADQIAYVDKVRRSTEKMNGLVNDFLDATKLEMGTFATKTGPVSLNTFMAHVLESFEAQIAGKSLELQAHIPATEVVLATDEALLHIIVSNLISNAVKYTPERGQIGVALDVVGNGVAFTVRDTGIGVPANDQPHLFSKLYRASNTKTSPTEGTGLGLYVVKQAVELLGGTIAFASTEGVGTEFVVTLPYQS